MRGTRICAKRRIGAGPDVLRSEVSVIGSALTSCPRLHRQPACCVSASRCRPIRSVKGAVLRARWLPGTCIGFVRHVVLHRLADSRRGPFHGIAPEQRTLSMFYICHSRCFHQITLLAVDTMQIDRTPMPTGSGAVTVHPNYPAPDAIVAPNLPMASIPTLALRVIRLLCGPSQRDCASRMATRSSLGLYRAWRTARQPAWISLRIMRVDGARQSMSSPIPVLSFRTSFPIALREASATENPESTT